MDRVGMHTPFARLITHPLWVLFVHRGSVRAVLHTAVRLADVQPCGPPRHADPLHRIWLLVRLGGHPDRPTSAVTATVGRLMLAVIAMLLHSFFAVPIMMSDTAFGVEWYSQVQPRGCRSGGRLPSRPEVSRGHRRDPDLPADHRGRRAMGPIGQQGGHSPRSPSGS